MSPPNRGFVVIPRTLLDHPLVAQLPAAWFRIWIVVLLSANWRETTWWDGDRNVALTPGSFVTLLEKLAVASGSSIRQVRSALDYFEKAKLMTRQTLYRHSIITVLDWGAYQGTALRGDKLRDHMRARSGQQIKK